MATPHEPTQRKSAPAAEALALDVNALEAVRRSTEAGTALPGDAAWRAGLVKKHAEELQGWLTD